MITVLLPSSQRVVGTDPRTGMGAAPRTVQRGRRPENRPYLSEVAAGPGPSCLRQYGSAADRDRHVHTGWSAEECARGVRPCASPGAPSCLRPIEP